MAVPKLLCSVTCCPTNSLEPLTGISFHRFPKEKLLRNIWQEATGKVHWTPSSISTICSNHFKDDDFSIRRSGRRCLRAGSVPTKDLYVEKPFFLPPWPLFPLDPDVLPITRNQQNTNTSSDLSQSASTYVPISKDYQQKQNEQIIANLQNIVMDKDKKINKQNIKIHSLQRRNYSLKKRVHNIQRSLTQLEEKFYLQMQFLEELRQISAEMMRTADDVRRSSERLDPSS